MKKRRQALLAEAADRGGDAFANYALRMGGGFYGAIAGLVLIWLELGEILELLGALGDVGALVTEVITGFFIDFWMNFVEAALWPLGLAGEIGWPATAVFFFFGSMIFEKLLANREEPWVKRLRDGDEETRSDENGVGEAPATPEQDLDVDQSEHREN